MKHLLALLLLTVACSANVEPEPAPTPEPAPECTPTSHCDNQEYGYIWLGLPIKTVGGCSLSRYVCVPIDGEANEACEQRWLTTCDPAPEQAGERGE